jgi:uncharacterized repeat protein (TIGR03803 family)
MKPCIFALLILTTLAAKAQSSVLWGTTAFGGNRNGVIFNYDLSTHLMHTACKFNDTVAYRSYTSLFKASNGLLYGTTPQGGTADNGTIFSFDPATGAQRMISGFPTGGLQGSSVGRVPECSLLQVGDSLLFATTEGGGSFSYGTILRYNLFTDSLEYLYNFNDNNGGPDGSLLLASNGLLYGLAISGNIYSYDINSGSCINVSDFLGQSWPEGDLVETSEGALYGLSIFGGNFNQGFIFKYDINTNTGRAIHSFDTTFGCYGFNGWMVPGLLLVSDTILYGVTPSGGLNQSGVLFSYSIPTGQYRALHNFGSGNDGSFPVAPLIKARDGLLYGTAQAGGAGGFGTLYSFDATTFTETVLHSFDSLDGFGPAGKLLEIFDTTTGMSIISANTQLQISPNPSTGQFIVQLPSNQSSYPTEVYNMLGQKIEQLTLSNAQNTLNLSNQAAGMYFVYVQTDNGPVTGKVMVER